ncbi:MAG: hypothetical protein MUC65_05405 [Pontiellaceae bacterium]|jgi:hypothetical protein|nr:hypothetical protein [Pontiellaceae bacterium]
MRTHLKLTWVTRIIIATVFMVSTLAAPAQTNSVNWSTLDGGGGTSTGSVYSVCGTIGQFDTGNLSGGSYRIDGGFWVPQAIQVENAPFLNIAAGGMGEIIISWNSCNTNWILQETSSLTNGWVNAPSGVTNPVVIPTTEAVMFYRLHNP